MRRKKHLENNRFITRRLWKPKKFWPKILAKKENFRREKIDVLSFIIFRKFQLQNLYYKSDLITSPDIFLKPYETHLNSYKPNEDFKSVKRP